MNKFAIEEALVQLEGERKQVNLLLTISSRRGYRSRLGYLTGSLLFAEAWLKKSIEALPGATAVIIEDEEVPTLETDVQAIEFVETKALALINAIKNDASLFADKPEAKWYQIAILNAYTYMTNVAIQIDIAKKAIAEDEKARQEQQETPEQVNAPDGTPPGTAPEGKEVTMTPPTGTVSEPTPEEPVTPPTPEEPLQGDALIKKQNEDLAIVAEKNLKSLNTPTETPQANVTTTEGANSTAGKNKSKRTRNSGGKK
jgi:hypothetical protein